MKEELKVFVVDDDPCAQMIACFQLESLNFQVSEFGTGETCLGALNPIIEHHPDIFLLDIEMPGMGGIALCRSIRATGNQHSQIIFISSRNDLDTRLLAYDAGGNDYLIKPYLPEELESKLLLAKQIRNSARELSEQASLAQETAITVRSSLQEMGVVQTFIRASFACQTPTQIATALFKALHAYQLEGLLELRLPAGASRFSSRGSCTALELSILTHTSTLQRLFQFRNRLSINYPHVTLLISNIPLTDPERVERLRDYLATIVENCEIHLQIIAHESARSTQARGIDQALTALTCALQNIDRQQHEYRQGLASIIDEHLRTLETNLHRTGSPDGHKNTLIALTEKMAERVYKLKNLDIDDQLQAVSRCLHEAVEEQARTATP